MYGGKSSFQYVPEASEKHLQGAHILAGNTAAGVYHEWPSYSTIINIKGVKELTRVSRSQVSIPPLNPPPSSLDFINSWNDSLVIPALQQRPPPPPPSYPPPLPLPDFPVRKSPLPVPIRKHTIVPLKTGKASEKHFAMEHNDLSIARNCRGYVLVPH